MFAGACVADVGARPIANEPPLAVELVWPQLLPLRAEPVVMALVVGEPRGSEAKRAPVRVGGEPLEREGAPHQGGAHEAGE